MDLRDTKTGTVTTEPYDKLVLAPGAASVHPPLPGIGLPGIFHVRTVPDTRAIREWLEKGTDFLAGMSSYVGIQMVKPVTRAVVVGGGFIGLETAENLIHRGFEVTLIQKGPQLLGPLDAEIACLVEGHMQKHGSIDAVCASRETAEPLIKEFAFSPTGRTVDGYAVFEW